MEPRHDLPLYILIILLGMDHVFHRGLPMLTSIMHGSFDFAESFVDRLFRLVGHIRRRWSRHSRK